MTPGLNRIAYRANMSSREDQVCFLTMIHLFGRHGTSTTTRGRLLAAVRKGRGASQSQILVERISVP